MVCNFNTIWFLDLISHFFFFFPSGKGEAEAVGLDVVILAEDDGGQIEGAELLVQDLVVGHVVDGGGGG